MRIKLHSLGLLTLLHHVVLAAITLDLTSQESMKEAARTAALGMVSYYTGDQPGDVPGNLPSPYYWWEAGAMFGALIDYWYFTGDEQFNEITIQAMMHQSGPNGDFMPPNQTKTEGNDDQAFWAMAALSAAENRFPNPPKDQPQWLALAQAAFNLQAARWHDDTCGGGLKWQIFAFNRGYNYKNSISNGCFFNIGARLAVYTSNGTYSDWADRTWNWMQAIGLIDPQYNIYDGADDNLNCTEKDHIQWTYNAGTLLVGAANMYNFTGGSSMWEDRIRGIITNLGVFMKDQVIWEAACEEINTCNIDQRSFKAYLARWIAATIVRAPFTRELLKPVLETSARAAVTTCTGGADGNQCGLRWWAGSHDGSVGVGEQMSALEVIQSNLADYVPGPATAENGISEGNPNAGTHSPVGPEDLHKSIITTADKAGAGIFTVIIAVLAISAAWWMVI